MNTKKILSLLLTFILIFLITVPALTVNAEESAGPGIYFIYADIQAEQTQINSDYGEFCFYATSWRHILPQTDNARSVNCDGIFYLAKNEREGVQIYITNPGDESCDIKVEISEFRNTNNDLLSSELFKEEYVTPNGTTWGGRRLYIADPLVPYKGETVTVEPGNNQAFYIETRSVTDQEAGPYYATVTFSNDDGIIATKTIAAIVWNFALPQQHYGSTVMGLHNASTTYGNSLNFLKQNGVGTYTYKVGNKTIEEILPEEEEKAERILEGWDEYLLDHGISSLELPRYMIDEDKKKAELAMADIRRKYYSIPLLDWQPTGSGSYNASTLSVINKYKSLIGDNDYLTSKAFFYCKDEVDSTQVDLINSIINAGNNAWPEVKKMFPYNGKGSTGTDYSDAVSLLDPYNNYVCFSTLLLSSYYTKYYSESLYNDFVNNYTYKWRYPCEIRTGGFELWISRLSTVGIYRRLPFWQQHNNNEDCLLYWNCGYIANNYDIWGTKCLPANDGASTGNGNGLLLYPGGPIGEDPCTPIGSLRIKQIASGLDDEDYLYLADEFLPESERPVWKEKSDYWWTRCDDMTNNRINLGNKLEKATIEHEFGEWHTVVEPDRTHNGLEIRECIHCGTEESRETDMLPSYFTGHSLTLNGNIGVNFYLDLTENETENATVDFEWMKFGSKQTASVDMSSAKHNEHGYIATCYVSAAEMTTDINATLTIGGEKVDNNKYTVKEYADYMLENADDNGTDEQKSYAEASPLVKAMLNYGTQAQIFFDVNTEKPANASLSSEDKAVPDITAADINKPYISDLTNLPGNVKVDNISLTLRSGTTLSLYFTSNSDLEFSCEGKTVDVKKKGTVWIARIKDIKAQELDNDFTLTVSNGTSEGLVTCSPLTYCYNVLENNVNDRNLATLVRSIYQYGTAAQALIG